MNLKRKEKEKSEIHVVHNLLESSESNKGQSMTEAEGQGYIKNEYRKGEF